MTRLQIGHVAIRLHLFGTADEELQAALHPPWPQWMERLYETEGIGDQEIDPRHRETALGARETTLGAALSAVASHLAHRLKLAAWAVGAMEQLGWQPRVDGQNVVLTRLLAPPAALVELEANGILGPVTKLCEMDETTGMPRIFERTVP